MLDGAIGYDTLDGGAGDDIMIGGLGDDTYIVQSQDDVVIEDVDSGIDTVMVDVDAAIGVGNIFGVFGLSGNVENAVMMNSVKDYFGIYGNDLNNSITGSGMRDHLSGEAGNDTLDGGAGEDSMEGGAGADTFIFNNSILQGSGFSSDSIGDFETNVDHIQLSQAVFAKLGFGGVAAGNLAIGAAALDGDDYLIYNKNTGALSYDADGNGAGAAKEFATLWDPQTTHPVLIGVADFNVVA
jgi:serralysin